MSHRRVPPDPTVPRVRNKAMAERIAKADAKSAEGYDALDEVREKYAELHRVLSREEVTGEIQLPSFDEVTGTFKVGAGVIGPPKNK